MKKKKNSRLWQVFFSMSHLFQSFFLDETNFDQTLNKLINLKSVIFCSEFKRREDLTVDERLKLAAKDDLGLIKLVQPIYITYSYTEQNCDNLSIRAFIQTYFYLLNIRHLKDKT